MANSKKTLEELRKKHGLSDNKSTTTSEKEVQGNSPAPTLEDIRKKYVTKETKSTSNTSTKSDKRKQSNSSASSSGNSNKKNTNTTTKTGGNDYIQLPTGEWTFDWTFDWDSVPNDVKGRMLLEKLQLQQDFKSGNSASEDFERLFYNGSSEGEYTFEIPPLNVVDDAYVPSEYEIETNNAYTNAKDKIATKTTISNGMSDDDRNARIKEIEKELQNINFQLQGLGRTSGYGGGKYADYYTNKSEELRKRKEELSKELTTLKREGTHTTSDMVQFKIDDLEAEKSKLPPVNNTARVSPSGVDAYVENTKAHAEIDKQIETLEREKELYDNISEYGNVVNKDDFSGQWRANYRSNELSREADKAMNEYLRNPTEENRQIAYAYDAFVREYMKNNEDALDDEGAVLPWFSRDLAGYLPQFKDQILPETIGYGLGMLFTDGSQVGGSVGAAMATYSQSYDVIRGSVYRTLLAEGFDEETALQAADDEALISSLIESGETAVSWLLAGSGKAWGAIKGAAQTSVAKGSTNGAVKFIAGLGTKSTGKAATKAAKAVATPMWKTGAKIVGGVGVNGFTEYGEEFLQQGVSIANRDRLANNTGDNLWEATGEVIKDVATGKNPEALSEMHEAGKTGFAIGVMMGGSRTTVNNIITHYANAKTVKAQNEFVDALINDDESLDALVEEGKASGEGSVSSKIATEVEEARAEGNVTREQVKKLIAANEVYIKEEERIAKATTPKTKATPKSGTPLHERLDALSQNNEPIAVEDVKKATGFGDNGSKLVATLANNEGVTFSQAERMVKNAYMAGLTNAEGKTANFATDTQIDAFTAGKQDRVMQELADKANAEDAVVNKKAGFVAKNLPSDVTQSQVELIDLISKAFGLKTFVKKGIKGNAEIDHSTGEVAINFDFEREVGPDNNRQKVSIVYHAVHEMAAHALIKRAPVEGRAFVNALYNLVAGDESSLVSTLADEKRREYAKQDVELSLAYAIEEVSANNIIKYLYDNDETKFQNAMEKIINGNDRKAKQGLQKYLEILNEIIRKIKNFIVGKKGKDRAELQAGLDEVTRVRDMFESAVAKAVENTKAQSKAVAEKRADTKSAKNLEIKTNKEYNGNVNHSLKWHTDLSATQIKRVVEWLRQEGSPEATRITDTANWYKGRISGKDLFVIYSSVYVNDPTILYEVSGGNASAELDILLRAMEVMESERSIVEKSRIVNELLDGDWVQEKHDMANNDVRPRGRGSNTGYASVLQGKSSKFIGSQAFRNVVKNLFDIQEEINLLKDSQGNDLTEGQQDYFADSKVRAENGNLLVMYQGSENDFTVFDRKKSSYSNLYGRGFYFTKSENHASQYGNTRAYYLDIKHPVSTTETTITKDQLRKFLQAVSENEDYSFENYGYGATVDSVLQSTYGKSDFLMLNDVSQTAIGDLVEAVELFNEINGTDYDGIILDTETVIFNSEQAKLTTNKNPTSNPDINFSLKKPVEETKNLIAVHNMQSSELERTLDLGGLPMPSIAIIKAQRGHSEYGDVSLVFDKSVIDPKANKLNKVYGGDAWTPTYPTIEYKPNEKIADKISGKYYELSRKFGNDEARPLYNYVYDLERQLNTYKGETRMLSDLYENTDVMQLYLLDSGKEKVETIKKETRRELTDADVEMREFFIKELGTDVIDEVVWDGNGAPFAYRKNYMSKYGDVIRETYKKLLSEVYKFSDEQVQNVLDSTKQSDYLKFVRDAYNYRKDGRVTFITENDYNATQQAIREAVGEDYRKWIDSLFKGIEEKSGIRNNVDYFTNSGNRRSWEALHWENNLENVVKVMKSQDDVGSVGFFSGQNIWGVAAKNYGSIEEIKADSDRLKHLPEEEYSKIKVGFGERLEEIARSIMDKDERNPFIALDNAMECIVDAVRNSKTKSGILNNLKQYRQLTVTETTVDDIVAIVTDISNMPTEYFEAKPKRAVELNEIATAIIPNNISKDTKARLDSLGIKYLEYEAGNEEARLKALNSLEDVQFSLKNTNNTDTKDRKELLDIIEHLKGEFEVTKFAKADPKKLAKLTKDLLKEYSSKADYDETRSAIDELYTYMANGEDGNTAVWDEVYNRAYNIAQNIVENSLVVDDEMYTHYKSLRDYLRTTPMKFDTRYDSVPSSYENFNEFRKLNMGRLKFTNDGRGIDSVYQELAGLYPEFFNEEEQNNASDQLERIIEVLDELQPTQINPFDRQISQVSMQLANDLTSRFFDLPQAKPTFADKAERRVVAERIKSGKKVEAVREKNKERIKKLIESQKAKTKKQLDKIREQRDTKVEKEKAKRREALAKKSESQKAKELRAKITRHAGELKKTLLKATDKKHIPAELENAVLALLYNINMESNYTYDVETNSYKKNDKGVPTNKTKAFLALKEVYADIAKNNDYGLTLASEIVDTTGDGVANIFDEVMKLSDTKIADMTSEELTKIYDAIRLIEHSIKTANKMFAIQRWEDLTKTAKAFELSVATRRPKHAIMKSHLTLDVETPLTFFSHFGVAGEELYQALRKAQDNEQRMIDELADRIQGIVSSEQVKKAEKEYHTFTTVEGKELTLSKAHIMDMYLLFKRKQGRKHLLYDPDSKHFGNGIHQPEIKGKHIRRDSESTRLTKVDLGKIFSKLDASDKAIADKMQKATLLLAKWGNKACMDVFGYEKFNDPDYWTIKSASESINQTPEKNKDIARSIKNMGSAKSVEEKAANAVDIGGIFNVFNQHASDMICYSAWLGVMEDATKLYNYTFRDAEGNKTNRTFQSMLEKYAGEGGKKYYFNLLKDIQNGISAPPDTATEGIYTRLYGMAAKAAVAFKATVVVQQPMSIVRATNTINPLSILQATVKGGVNLPVWAVSKVKNIVPGQSGQLLSEWYGGWQKALKYSPIASRKAIGGYEINSNSSGLKGVLYNPDTIRGKAVDALKESPLWAAGKADELTWGLLWNACEIETRRKNKALEKGSEAYYEAVNELFTKVINETQVVDGVLQRSQLMRSSSGWIKPATSFTGEPTQALNAVIRAYDNLRYETNPAKRGKKIKAFGRATTVFLMSAVFTAFARSLAVGLTGEDEEEYWDKVWKSFSGVQGDEETWFDYVKNIGLKSDAVNNVNPFTWLPITREIMSMVEGYDVERLDVGSLSKFVKEAEKFIESFDEEGKYTVGYSLRNLLLKTAEFTGYSPYNLIKDIEGAIRTTKRESEDYKGLYEMEKKRTKPANNTSAYIDILYKAYSTDSEDYEYIYEDLVKEIKEGLLEKGIELTEDDKKDGKTVEMVAQEKAEETIESGMETHMKKAEGVEKSSELTKRYMSPETEDKYDSSLNRVKSSDVWKSANAEQRKNAEADLYKFLTSTTEDVEKLREEARMHGVDETEYTLYQLAIEMADQPKGQKGSGSYDLKEKAEAINSLNLGDEEIAYFFGKGLQENAKEELQETLDAGIDMQKYVNFKAAVSDMEADKNAKGNSIPNSKKKKVVKYLNNANLTDEEWEYFYYEIMNYKK